MKVFYRFALVLLFVLMIASVLLAPRRSEQFAVLADEGRHKEIIAELERRIGEGQVDPEMLGALSRSYAAIGEYDRAVDWLGRYLGSRPKDFSARERYVELLGQTGSVDRYLDGLAGLVASNPSPDRIQTLAELYRLHGKFKEELSTLRAYAISGDIGLRELERLGALLAADNRWSEARHWLEVWDKKAGPEAISTRFLLLHVLMRSGNASEALRRARIWSNTWHEPGLSVRLIVALANFGFQDEAGELARSCLESFPTRAFDVIGELTREGYLNLSRELLFQWSVRSVEPTVQDLRVFVYASKQAGDAQGPFKKLVRMAREGAAPEAQGRLAEEISSAFGKSALVSVAPLLSEEVLSKTPLFAAELSMLRGNRELARWFLNRTDLDQLSAERARAWLAMLQEVEMPGAVFMRLTELWKDKRLPVELMPTLAEEALKFGQTKMHRLILTKLRQQGRGEANY